MVYSMGNAPTQVTSVASTFSQNVQESINESISTTVANASSTSDNTQYIKIGSINCTQGTGIGAITQTMRAKIDVTALLKSLNEANMRQVVNNAIDQALKKDQSNTAGFMSTSGGTSDTNTAYQNNVNRLRQSFSYGDFVSSLQKSSNSQSIDITDINGLCDGGGISQSMEVSIAIKAVADKLTKTLVDIATEAQQKQDLESAQTNTSSGPLQEIGDGLSGLVGSATSAPMKILLLFIGIIAAIILAIWGIRWAFSKKEEPMTEPPEQRV
jgi:uncharacterized protein YbbK (DUF523 family)